ncbi:single-stranded-DNA-specific exonuclease RecJ [Parahaliea sp. F7430]|uniref:Single-stranded-DNA-specific exonuclease RecJ n=1 Tax=Sediminihaliea albiluteola TaxID=2758564 RepID=A0A7W2TXI1_9GAMM|nr:single-stranded-DNA-specific exonuclease RecJ [Sediminihaliea albiluteola]MBA6413757.1 single-stranded-DNA-specific exonuclease RecJ [Sediminihaliea albiluteola]
MLKTIRRRQASSSSALAAADLPPLLQRVYCNRGIRDISELDLGLEHLLPPATLHGAVQAAELLADSLAARQRILIVGDFDADGATSTALGMSVLQAFGAAHVDYLVPNRFDYGYGLTPEIVELALERSPDLIITVDNGISSISGIALARQHGIATLVTDHHLAGAELPAADVIVNPNQPACQFASKSLAGVGVIFYVMLALRAELRRRQWFAEQAIAEPNLGRWLDLVALGTVADVVPLDRNNRILVDAGLKRIRAGQARPGILALLEVAGRQLHTVVASDLGFAAGPRLNAAGRLDDMSVGIECLLSQDAERARAIAAQLQQLNQDRRSIEQGMQDQALNMLAELDLDGSGPTELPLAVTLYEPDWHQGVIGILASRVKDRLHRPTIAFANADDAGEEIKGSARSIPGIHIRDVLDAVATRYPHLISKFGGHAMAAGLSIQRAHYDQFSEAFSQEVARHADAVDLQAVVESDGALSQADFALDNATALRFAGPWGQHFPEPVFDGHFQIVSQRLVGERHLKLVLSLPDSDHLVDAIAFNIDPQEWPNERVEYIEAAYRLDVNEFRGQRSLQLMIEFLQPSS